MIDTLIIFCAKYLIVFPAAVLLGYFLFIDREKKYRLVSITAIAVTVAYALARVASNFYNDPLPFVVNNTKPLFEHAANNGFPSDHTLFAATLASVVFYFNKRMGLLLWAVAFIIGFSRVLAGVHHVIDILGAMAIAICATLAAHYIVEGLRGKKPQAPQSQESAS